MGCDTVTCDGCDGVMFFEDLAKSGLCHACDKDPQKLREELKRVVKRADAIIRVLREQLANAE